MRVSYVVFVVLSVSLTYFLHCCASRGGGGFHEEDCRALSQIRDSLNSSYVDSYWVGKNCCEWSGVECHPSLPFRVVHLDMAAYAQTYRDEQGDWYPNATLFAQLNQLTFLRLSFNQIGGWVTPQALCELRHLRHLNLEGNYLDDDSLPRCLWNQLSSLESLDLSWNHFNGSFGTPNALCELRNLQELKLGDNNIVIESLPLCLWHNLSSLKILNLSGNRINGSLGTLNALCGSRNLQELWLSGNNLVIESFPLCLGRALSSLEILDLSDNHLNSSFGSLNAFCGLGNLRELDLRSSQVDDGSLPPCLWHNLSLLERLDLSENNLKGSSGIPKGNLLLVEG